MPSTVEHSKMKCPVVLLTPLIPNIRYTHHALWCSKCQMSLTDDGNL